MKDITNYLQSKNIEATFVSSSLNSLDEIRFRMYDYDAVVRINDATTVDEFLEMANTQYLNHLKNQYESYKSMANGYKRQVEEYKPILTK